MSECSEEVISEAVELCEAVFYMGETEFEESYEGKLDSYRELKDMRKRIEEGIKDSGGDEYRLSILPSFSDLGDRSEAWASVFYSLSPDASYDDFVESSGFSRGHMNKVLSDLEEECLMTSIGGERHKSYFYGENAFPYLMILSEAEKIVEELDNCEDPTENEEEIEMMFKSEGEVERERGDEKSLYNRGNGKSDETEDTAEEAGEDGDKKSLEDIMMDVAEDKEDLRTTFEQKDDGGLESRDHADTDTDDSSNPSDDDYYEGW